MRNTRNRILVVNDGKTGDFSSKIMNYLESYTELIELRDLRHFQAGELEEEITNYDKTIFICKVGFRMRLNQENMIRDLDQQIQNNLQVFYLLKQGAGSYCVAGCRAQQLNVFLHEIDEEFIEESLKDFVNSVGKWRSRMMPIFFLTLLAIASVYSILPLNSSAFEDAQICERLESEIWQISQDYIDLIQINKRLVEENLGIQQGFYQENEQKYCVQNGDFVEKLEELKSLIFTLKRGDHKKESYKTCEEIRNKHDQILKSNKELEKENSELKERLVKERQQHEESEKKFVAQKSEFELKMLEIRNECQELRNVEQQMISLV